MKKLKMNDNGDLVFAGTGKGILCYRAAADRSQSMLTAAVIGIMTEGHVEVFAKCFEGMMGNCNFHCSAFDQTGLRVRCNAVGAEIGELELEE